LKKKEDLSQPPINTAAEPREALSSGRNNRSLRGLLVQPRSQFRYAFLMFGGGLFILVGLISYFMFSLLRTLEALSARYAIEPAVIEQMQRAILSTFVMTAIFGTVLAAITFSAGLAISHRVFGTMVPFSRHLTSLIHGDYSSRVDLRKKDEFQELKILLNTLAENLESNQAKPKPNT
jgi:HAMP domain-containing protein